MNLTNKLRQPLVIGNWKLNGSKTLIGTFIASQQARHFLVDYALCPPNIFIAEMFRLSTNAGLLIGAQNVSEYEGGAFTGEVSAAMLTEVGCKLCLVGHSERRAFFNETNQSCRIKVNVLLEKEIMPVLCIGENKIQRETNITKEIVLQQLNESLEGVKLSRKKICIAYEPVWAIGTGLAATPEMAQEVHDLIRSELTKLYDAETANSIRILYGGSVTRNNISELIQQPDIDGALVGGASLDPDHFFSICELASR